MSALNPVYTVGAQIDDVLRTNLALDKAAARERTIELLDLVGIPSASSRVDIYVHEFSGGMRQRVMLALALSCDPTFLIADEPTTALDVTIQATILELISSMIERFDMSLLFITHNLGVVAHACDRIGVMYASHLVETGDKAETFCQSDASVHHRTHELDSSHGCANTVPHTYRRFRMQHDGPTARVQVSPSLHARDGYLSTGSTTVSRSGAEPLRGLSFE